MTNELANEVKKSATDTSTAPVNETCRKVNRLKTGPFVNPIKAVRAWFMLIIVVI